MVVPTDQNVGGDGRADDGQEALDKTAETWQQITDRIGRTRSSRLRYGDRLQAVAARAAPGSMGSAGGGAHRTVNLGGDHFSERANARVWMRWTSLGQAPLPRPRRSSGSWSSPSFRSSIRCTSASTTSRPRWQVKQDKVPVIDANGKQVISANGSLRTRIQVTRQNVTTYKYNGFGNMSASFTISTSRAAIGVTFIFVIIAVPGEIILGLVLAVLFNPACRCAGCGAPS